MAVRHFEGAVVQKMERVSGTRQRERLLMDRCHAETLRASFHSSEMHLSVAIL